jgi:hypothetical protein
MKVTWSDEAKAIYYQKINELLEDWPVEVAIKLENSVNELIHNLEYHNHICPASKKSISIRRCVISKHNSIIYTIENNTIHLVGFIHNKSDHKY